MYTKLHVDHRSCCLLFFINNSLQVMLVGSIFMILFVTVLCFLLFIGFFMRSWVLCSVLILCFLLFLAIFCGILWLSVAFMWLLARGKSFKKLCTRIFDSLICFALLLDLSSRILIPIKQCA